MDNALNQRCCMCPQQDRTSRVCPGIPGTPHPHPSPCRFIRWYRDQWGYVFFVRAVSNGKVFRIWVHKPGKSPQFWRAGIERSTFDAAQADLNSLAEQCGWQPVR